ncbi:MAG TPA: YoaK family protein [Bryobacteraceae bacterium]|nr:YoaK family protein [Bryobacteraceae bacterium]
MRWASPRNQLPGHPKAWVAASLAWTAGFVDITVWLVLYQVYTSHMTGNTASFADDIAQCRWGEAFHHGWIILPFVCGLLYSAATTKAARRRGFHSSFSIALITEVLLLGAFIALGSRYIEGGKIKPPPGFIEYLLLSLPAAAMGVQTVTVTNINGLRVYTTYLTGSLSKFGEAVTDYLFWLRDRTRGRLATRLGKVLRVSPRRKSFRHAVLTASLWFGFFLGALCGAIAEQRFVLYGLYAPIAILTVAIIIDVMWPVAAADEPQAGESAH